MAKEAKMMIEEVMIKDLLVIAKEFKKDHPEEDTLCSRDYYHEHGNYPRTKVKKFFGTFTSFRQIAKIYKDGGDVFSEYRKEQGTYEDVNLEETHYGNNYDLISTSSDIKTLRDLIEFCKVDLTKWEVTKHVVNSWVVNGKENFQVKAWLKAYNPEFNPKLELERFYKKAVDRAPVYDKIKYKDTSLKSGNLLEISLYDHHFGQLSWSDETGYDNYNLAIAQDRAIKSISYFIEQIKHLSFEKVLIVIGNDFFNVNNSANTTAGGTLQAEDDRWQKTFMRGWELWVTIIDMLQNIAPVEIKIIAGNHDEERIFYLGETLRAWYSKCDNVIVDNSPKSRKYFQWGNVLLGFTHGNKEVKGALVNLMAVEQPILWSQTKYREWHKGHLHHAKAQAFQILDEVQGVREWILPSLVSIDDWHAGKGYSALKESIVMLWNKEKGKTSMLFYHPEE